MGDNSMGLHEDRGALSALSLDKHRAIASLMEELEAVDWYDQRVQAASDPELAAILAHNRDEEKEHAIMTLEWLRRHDTVLDEQMRTYLFTEVSILEVEDSAMGRGSDVDGAGSGAITPTGGSLGIGSLKGAGE